MFVCVVCWNASSLRFACFGIAVGFRAWQGLYLCSFVGISLFWWSGGWVAWAFGDLVLCLVWMVCGFLFFVVAWVGGALAWLFRFWALWWCCFSLYDVGFR